ncbi:MAG: hypothetical protein K6T54_03920 [Ignavibacterium sp.]|nr:hypothetical protein [Ignavibacterium sp.]
MWFLYLTSIIPLPVFSIPFWFFTANRKPQFAANCKALINYQFNIMLFVFISILLIPLFVGVILILLLLFFHLKFILSSFNKNNSLRLPFSFTFIK